MALLEVASKKGDSAKYGSTRERFSELGGAGDSVVIYQCWCECRPSLELWAIAIVSRPEVAPAP